MDKLKQTAADLLTQFKGDAYAHGLGAIERAGEQAARLGDDFFLVYGQSTKANGMYDGLKASLADAGLPEGRLELLELVADGVVLRYS